jgi:hypothetical protein
MWVVKDTGKAIPLQAWTGPEGSRRSRLPEFLDSRHMKVVGLSALRTDSLYPPGIIPGILISVTGWVDPNAIEWQSLNQLYHQLPPNMSGGMVKLLKWYNAWKQKV